jgi:hypothetical protein
LAQQGITYHLAPPSTKSLGFEDSFHRRHSSSL